MSSHEGQPQSTPESTAELVARLLSSSARTATSSVIRDLLQHANRPGVISLAGGIPAPELFPLERLANAATSAISELGAEAAQYGLTEGVTELRELLAAEASVEAPVTPSRVVVTTGSQQAIDLIGRVLIDEGDTIVTDDPAYLGALQALRGYNPKLVGVRVDDEGLDTDHLAELLTNGLRPVLVYTNPNFQNPTGNTMTLPRRKALAALADAYGFLIIEDDPYGALRFDGEPDPSLAAFSDRVVRIRTVSKTLAPGLRVAWVFGPQKLIDSLVIAKQAVDLHTSTFTQHTALRLLKDPTWYTDHQATLGPWYRDRRDALSEGLTAAFGDELTFNQPSRGMFLWAELADATIDTSALLDVALDEGVAFVPGSAFAVDRPLPSHLRLSFATPSPTELIEAASRLRTAVDKLSAS